MPELYRPGLPTQYEHPGAEIKGRQKLGVKIENPGLDALRQAYADEPGTDKLLHEAERSLALSHGNDTYEGYQQEQRNDRGAEADAAAGREQARMQDESRTGPVWKRAAMGGLVAASLAPLIVGSGGTMGGLVAPAADLAMGVGGAASLPEDIANKDWLGAVGDATMMIPGVVSARHMMKAPEALAAAREAVLANGQRTASMMFPEELSAVQKSTDLTPAMSSKQSGIPPVQHYWDAVEPKFTNAAETTGLPYGDLSPAKATKIAAGRDKGARASLEGLQAAGKQSRGALAARLAGAGDDLAVIGAKNVPRDSSEGARSVPSASQRPAYAGAGDETYAERPPGPWDGNTTAPIGAGPERFQNQATKHLTAQEKVADLLAKFKDGNSLDAIDENQARQILREIKARGSAKGVR